MAKRIAHMLNSMGMGGIENFLMNIYRDLDKEKYQFDFILQSKEESFFEKEIKELGGNIYKIPRFEKHPLKHLLELRKILKSNDYIAFHRHTASSVVFVDLAIAKLAGVKNRIVHSHNTLHPKKFLNTLFSPILYALSTDHLACGNAAGEWLYGNKKFDVINNAIQTEKYQYDESIRNEYRKKLGFSDADIVLGHVGRFDGVDDQKNQKFIIDAFIELHKLNKNYKLVFCGDGGTRGTLNIYCKEQGLDNDVLFLGVRKDVPKLFQAFDAFVFPSRYEGLPVALIEAQLTALPCFISNKISDEAIYNNNILKIGISEEDKEEWCRQIMALPITTAYRTYKNENLYNDYDVKKVTEKLLKIYNNS